MVPSPSPMDVARAAASRLGCARPVSLLTEGLVNVVARLEDGNVLRVAASRVTDAEWCAGMVVADALVSLPGAPVRTPAPLTPLPLARSERACVWEGFVPVRPADPAPSWSDLGRQLRTLHDAGPRLAALPGLAGRLRRRDLADDVPARLDAVLATNQLTPSRAAVLRAWLGACVPPADLRVTLVHGDVWPKNVLLLADGRGALLDWDEVGLAPIGWDLATVVASHARNLLSDADLAAFASGYGAPVVEGPEVRRMLLVLELRAALAALSMTSPGAPLDWLDERFDLLAGLDPRLGPPPVAALHQPPALVPAQRTAPDPLGALL